MVFACFCFSDMFWMNHNMSHIEAALQVALHQQLAARSCRQGLTCKWCVCVWCGEDMGRPSVDQKNPYELSKRHNYCRRHFSVKGHLNHNHGRFRCCTHVLKIHGRGKTLFRRLTTPVSFWFLSVSAGHNPETGCFGTQISVNSSVPLQKVGTLTCGCSQVDSTRGRRHRRVAHIRTNPRAHERARTANSRRIVNGGRTKQRHQTGCYTGP